MSSHQPVGEQAEGPDSLETGEQVRLMGQGLVNGTSKILLGLVAIFLVPVMLKGLGTELFGLWLFISTVVNAVSTVSDLGVQVTVIREVGAAGEDTGQVAPFLKAAANLYLQLTIVGALAIIIAVALLLGRSPEVPEAGAILSKVVIAVSIGFVADQLCSFHISVLQGLRRFGLANLLAIASSLLNAFVVVGVLALGGRLLGVVEGEALVSILALVAAYTVVAMLAPRLRPRLGLLDFNTLRPHISVSLLSQLSVITNAILWNGPPMLIAVMLGPASLVPYQLGCKFPLAVGNFAWDLAAVMIPIASRHQRINSTTPAGEAFEVGTRGVTVLTLPIYIVLWVVGPSLLRAWLGVVPDGALTVLRLMCIAGAIGAIDVVASSILLGRGMVAFLSVMTSGIVIVVLPVTALLLYRIGPEGAAWAMAGAAPIAAAAVLRAAGSVCEVSLSDLARRIARDIWLPSIACACTAMLIVHSLPAGRWLSVIAAGSAGVFTYFIIYFVLGARDEERLFLRRGLTTSIDLLLAAAAAIYPAFQTVGRALGLKAANYPRLAAIIHSIGDPYKQPTAFESQYAATSDHWGYTTKASERERHLLVVQMLSGVHPG